MSSAAPILLGRLVGWDGPIAGHKFAGIALGVLAVSLCTLHKDDLETMKSRRRWLAFALLGMLLNGIASVAMKAVAGLGLGGHAVVFNLLFFPAGAAIAGGLIPLAARGPTFRGARWKMESSVGVAVGLLGAAQLAAGLYAVPRIHSAVIFPTYAILPLVLTSLGGRMLFGERLGPLERAGLVTACAALAMLNV
jgi:drug/metabolite transporter (DMT)-like permease